MYKIELSISILDKNFILAQVIDLQSLEVVENLKLKVVPRENNFIICKICFILCEYYNIQNREIKNYTGNTFLACIIENIIKMLEGAGYKDEKSILTTHIFHGDE